MFWLVGIFFVMGIGYLYQSGELNSFSDSLRSPYRKKHYLFTLQEKACFEALHQWNMQNQYYIFPKIRLGDLVYIPKNVDGGQGQLRKIHSKHIDFVICNPKDFRPLVAIKLDYSSHLKINKIRKDQKDKMVDKVLQDAGLPLLRIPAQRSYHLYDFSDKLNDLLCIVNDRGLGLVARG